MKPLFRTLGVVAAAIAVSLLVGCVSSVHPVYTASDVTFDPSLAGVWRQPDSPETWNVRVDNENRYRLLYTDRNGNEVRFIAHMATFDGATFLDLFPDREAKASSAWADQFHHLPLHTIYLVKQRGPQQFVAASLDVNWLNGHLKSHPTAISHTVFEGRTLFTASTLELQRFFAAHREQFKHDIVLNREK